MTNESLAASDAPPRPSRVLQLAGIYNVAWGAFAILFPAALFRWCGMAPPEYPWLWQCIGMIVGVYGIGYWIAARDPRRHWPIVLVGLLGKIFGPIGFVAGAWRGDVPWSFGATILTNDLIWWIPFTRLLWEAARAADAPTERTPPESIADALARTRIDGGAGAGRTLAELSREGPLLLVFLRHAGCTFFRSYSLDDVARIADPERRLYRAFAVGRGRFAQLFGPRVWWRGIAAGLLRGHGVGALAGDGFQLAGAFLVRDGAIVAGRPHRDAAERPDYVALSCAVAPPTRSGA